MRPGPTGCLMALLLAPSCTRSVPTPARETVSVEASAAVSSVATASAPAPAGPQQECQRIRAITVDALTTAWKAYHAKDAGTPPPPPKFEEEKQLVAGDAEPFLDDSLGTDTSVCIAGRGGFWGLAIAAAEQVDSHSRGEGYAQFELKELAVIHINGAGELRQLRFSGAFQELGFFRLDAPPLRVGAVDGGGVDGVLVRWGTRFPARVRALFRRGVNSVEELDVGQLPVLGGKLSDGWTVEDWVDKTGDGLPDLVVDAPLSSSEHCSEIEYDDTQHSQPFLIVATNEHNYLADSLASRQFLKGWCPASPKNPDTHDEILCARLWGADSATLGRYLRRTFRSPTCQPTEPQNATSDLPAMLTAANVTVPLRLDRPLGTTSGARPSGR